MRSSSSEIKKCEEPIALGRNATQLAIAATRLVMTIGAIT